MNTMERNSKAIQIVAAALTVLAVWFAKMPCWGKIYEPNMPEQLMNGR